MHTYKQSDFCLYTYIEICETEVRTCKSEVSNYHICT